MGGAIIKGLCKGTKVASSEIFAANPSSAKLEKLAAECPGLNIFNNNAEAAAKAELIILAVKPWKLNEVIDDLKPVMDYSRQAVASVAGGVGLGDLSALLDKGDGQTLPIYYIIPNTAASVGESMTFI